MVCKRHAVYDFTPDSSHCIRMADNDVVQIKGVGKLDLLFATDDGPFIVTLDRVVVVEGLATDLFSLRAMDRGGHRFVGDDVCISMFDGRLKFKAEGNL